MQVEQYILAFLSLLFVLALIGISSLVLRKFSFGKISFKHDEKKERNLFLVESMAIDSKRRLVLVRNRNKKHLILLGDGNDVLIESYENKPEVANEQK